MDYKKNYCYIRYLFTFVSIINNLIQFIMGGTFDIKSPNWLGGNNVHNTVQIVLLVAIAWKLGVFKR